MTDPTSTEWLRGKAGVTRIAQELARARPEESFDSVERFVDPDTRMVQSYGVQGDRAFNLGGEPFDPEAYPVREFIVDRQGRVVDWRRSEDGRKNVAAGYVGSMDRVVRGTGREAPVAFETEAGERVTLDENGGLSAAVPEGERLTPLYRPTRDIPATVGRGLQDLVTGFAKGAIATVDEPVDQAAELVVTLGGLAPGGKEALQNFAQMMEGEFGIPAEVELAPENLTEALAFGAGQVATIALPANAALKSMGLASAFWRAMATGSIVDVALFDPEFGTAGDMLDDLGKIDNPTLERIRSAWATAFATDADDSTFEKYLTAALEGATIGLAFEGIVGAYRFARSVDPNQLRQVLTRLGAGLGGAGVAGGNAQAALNQIVSDLSEIERRDPTAIADARPDQGEAGTLTQRLTGSERAFFRRTMDSEADLARLTAAAPSFRVTADGMQIGAGDLDTFERFIDESAGLRQKGQRIPPRFRDGSFLETMTSDASAAGAEPSEPELPEETEVAMSGGFVKALQTIAKARGATKQAAKRAAKVQAEAVEQRRKDLIRVRPLTEQEQNEILRSMPNVDITEGFDFNFDKIQTNDDSKRIIQEVSQRLAKQIDKNKRGHVRREVTAALARDLDMTERLLTRQIGEVFNAHEMLAARMLVARSAIETDRLALDVINDVGGIETELKFRRQFALHAALQMQAKGAETEIARAVDQFNIPIGPDGQPLLPRLAPNAKIRDQRSEELEALLSQTAGGHWTTEWIARRYLHIRDTAGRGAANKFASKARGNRWLNAFYDYWFNSMLSGIPTHIRNIVGSQTLMAWSVPVHLLAGSIGSVRGALSGDTDRVFLGESLARLYGATMASRDAFRAAGRAFIYLESADPQTKFEGMRFHGISGEAFNQSGTLGKGIDWFGHIITQGRWPSRALMAEDQFFKGIASRGTLHELAYRRGMQEMLNGGSASDMADVITDTLLDPPEDVLFDIQKAARYYTLQDELTSPFLRNLQSVMRTGPGRIIAPFFRTSTNIMKRFAENNILTAYLVPEVREAFRQGGAARDIAIARMALGSMTMAAMASLAMEGKITGRGPEDKDQRDLLRQQGWQPYSAVFDVGEMDKTQVDELFRLYPDWVSMGRDDLDGKLYVWLQGFEPINLLATVSADAVDLLKWTDNPDVQDSIAAAAVLAIWENMKSRSFLEGTALFISAIDDGPGAATNWIQRFVQSQVARNIGRTAVVQDPFRVDIGTDPRANLALRQWQAIWRAIQSQIPDMPDVQIGSFNPREDIDLPLVDIPKRRDLPRTINFWGDPVPLGEGNYWEYINPFYTSRGKFDPLKAELERLNMPIQMKGLEKIEGVALNPKEIEEYKKLQGKVRVTCAAIGRGGQQSLVCVEDPAGMDKHEAMTNMLVSDDYAIMNDYQRLSVMRRIHEEHVAIAREKILNDKRFPDLRARVEGARIDREQGISR